MQHLECCRMWNNDGVHMWKNQQAAKNHALLPFHMRALQMLDVRKWQHVVYFVSSSKRISVSYLFVKPRSKLSLDCWELHPPAATEIECKKKLRKWEKKCGPMYEIGSSSSYLPSYVTLYCVSVIRSLSSLSFLLLNACSSVKLCFGISVQCTLPASHD